jgi:anaerobic ribonucleoside-triphosphate reductase
MYVIICDMPIAECPKCHFSMKVVRAIPKVCPACGNDKPPEAFVPWWRKVAVRLLTAFYRLFLTAGGARNGRAKGFTFSK